MRLCTHLQSCARLLIAATAFVLLSAGSQAATTVQLADIVGGGDGSGSGTPGAGIDPSTGGTAPPAFFQIEQPNNSNIYHSSAVIFVDGVFIPDGGAGAVTLDSSGNSYASFPNTDSLSWDRIRNGPNQNGGTQLSSVNYNAAGRSMIGLHSNKGITFDLAAIQAAHPGEFLTSFTAVAGMTHLAGGYGTSDWWVFVDGQLIANQTLTPGGVGFSLNLPLNPSNQFLTLVATDAGDNFLVDQIIFGDPIVHLAPVPEPASLVMLALGLVGLVTFKRKRS